MKITLQPTRALFTVNLAVVGLWTGETDQGCPIHVYVARIDPQTKDPEQLAAFEKSWSEADGVFGRARPLIDFAEER